MLCIGGVFCVLQPWHEEFNPTLTAILLGYIGAILCGVTLTIDAFLIHHYTYLQKRENQFVTLFWYCIPGVIISAIGSIVLEEQTFFFQWMDWIPILVHCMTNFIMSLIYFYTCRTIPGIIISLIASTSTIYMVIAQYTVLSNIQRGNHNWLELLGAGIVLISSLSALLIKARTA